MMMKSHLVIALGAGLLLLPAVHYWVPFIPVLLVAGLLPDVDIAQSYLGKKWYFRPLQLFVSHRGIIHSLSLCFLLTLILSFFLPVLALPFFVGYAIHLFLDSLGVEGVRPFWPLKGEVSGIMKVGGKIEESVFVVFCILDAILFIRLFV